MGDSGAGFEINAGVVITIVLIVIVLLILASCINIVPQAHAYIIERGKESQLKRAGDGFCTAAGDNKR